MGSLVHRTFRAIAAAMMLLGCSRPPAATHEQEPIHVITPVYAVADLVRQIGGNRVDVQWWVESGQSLDDLTGTPPRITQVRNADLVVTRGLMDPWTLDRGSNEYESNRVLRIDRVLSARDGDPRQYLWLDPRVILELTDELTQRLATLEPRSDKMFKANAAALRAKVLEMTDAARPKLDAAKAGFLTLDRGFMPLALHFGLTDVRVEQIDLADPSSYGVKVLRETAKAAGTDAIFVNEQTPVAQRRDWESRLGLKVLPLDALGSSAPGGGRSTYLQILQYNLDQLIKGVSSGHGPATTSTAPGASTAPAAASSP